MSLLCRYVTVASNESRFLFNLTEKEKNVTSFSAIRIEERKSDVENYVSTFYFLQKNGTKASRFTEI